MTSTYRRFPALIGTLAVAIVCTTLADSAHAEGTPAAAPTQLDVDPSRASARATFETFLSTIVAAREDDGSDLGPAVACLDLSELPPAGSEEVGIDLALKLKDVIDRIAFVELSTVPNDASGSPYVFWKDPATSAAIVIARTSAGDWRFTRATVAAIDQLYRAAATRARVAGVTPSPTKLSPALWLRSQMPSELRNVGFVMEHWQWLALFVLLGLGVLVSRLARLLIQKPLGKALTRREWRVPTALLKGALRPLGLIAMSLVWITGLRWLGLPPELHSFFSVLFSFLAALGCVWLAFAVINIIANILSHRAVSTPGRFDDLLVPLFRKSAKIVATAIGVVFIADVVGISPASLLAGLGLGGLAVALAAQDTVKNFFGSLTVLLDRPFEIGDAVIIGGDTEGVIEEVGFRSTRIRTYENSLITLPNSNLISAKVDNLGKRNFRRFKTTLGLSAETAPAQVDTFCQQLEARVGAHPVADADTISVHLDALGASTLDVVLVARLITTDSGVANRAKHEILLDILRLGSELGVEFPYPTQTLHVRTPTEDVA